MTRGMRVLGVVTFVALAVTVLLALVVSPADVNQKDAVRMLYLHVPTAWLSMYLSFGVTSIASGLYLWGRTRSRLWDLVAGASAEIGVLFLGLTLVVGSIWGHTTWGIWWTWDARLTTTAVLFVLYFGYLALRRVPGDPEVRAKRCAVLALAAFVNVPIVHKSVEWWRTLHQPASILDERRILGEAAIHGVMFWTLMMAVLAFTLLYAWLLGQRVRVARMQEEFDERLAQDALAERRAEADDVPVLSPAAPGAGVDS